MYSRNTDRGGRRIKLPPGYDGSAFRHDTGEVRRFAEDMDMKIHSPAAEPERVEKRQGGGWGEEQPEEEKYGFQEVRWPDTDRRAAKKIPEPPEEEPAGDAEELRDAAETAELQPVKEYGIISVGKHNDSLLEGLLAGLGSEEWLLFLVILLLVADGSDCWDVILLLGLLLAVRDP